MLLVFFLLATPEDSERNYNKIGDRKNKWRSCERNRIICRTSGETDETDNEHQDTDSYKNDILFIHQITFNSFSKLQSQIYKVLKFCQLKNAIFLKKINFFIFVQGTSRGYGMFHPNYAGTPFQV